MKTIQEQIAVMQHFANGGEVEYYNRNEDIWQLKDMGNFNWKAVDYRIKEQKKTVTMEKWLCKNTTNEYFVKEGCSSYLEDFSEIKIKLLETYEVEL